MVMSFSPIMAVVMTMVMIMVMGMNVLRTLVALAQVFHPMVTMEVEAEIKQLVEAEVKELVEAEIKELVEVDQLVQAQRPVKIKELFQLQDSLVKMLTWQIKKSRSLIHPMCHHSITHSPLITSSI